MAPALLTLMTGPTAGGLAPGAASGLPPFALDSLSAWFVVVVLGVGGAAGVYGVWYLAPERPARPVGLAHALFALLLAALVGVVTATTVVAFLASWEVMALSAYFLVVFENEQHQVRRIGFIYLVLTHLATLTLMGMFAAWSPTDIPTTFAQLAGRARSGAAPTTLILGLASLGFGIKAGLVPVHFWLPGAHAAAPSHVSAVLSGVMLKTGVYGLFRVINLLGAPPAWWGWTLLGLGLISSVLGVLWALGQHDLKRLLAYHSVENVGIIFLGLGTGVLGMASGHSAVAALGYSGALLHSLNHALFKSLLFLGAGAVGRATGTREIARLGGLARRMPRTAVLFLIGSIAIVGLPPFNGLISEWLVFQGLFDGARSVPGLRPAVLGVAALAITGALALACFAKVFATVFLGHPRDPTARAAGSADEHLDRPQYLLAAGCLAIGVVPLLGVAPAARVTTTLGTVGLGADSVGALLPLGGIGLVLSLGVAGLFALLARRRLGDAPAPTWGCAYPTASPRMQYTAGSFANPILHAFGPLAGVREERTRSSFRVHSFDLVFDDLGRPLWRWIQSFSARLRFLQAGPIRWYLLYFVFTLVILLIYLAVEPLR
jgi:hydrogenase-4 component B